MLHKRRRSGLLDAGKVKALRNELVASCVEDPVDITLDLGPTTDSLLESEAAAYPLICLEQHTNEHEVHDAAATGCELGLT